MVSWYNQDGDTTSNTIRALSGCCCNSKANNKGHSRKKTPALSMRPTKVVALGSSLVGGTHFTDSHLQPIPWPGEGRADKSPVWKKGDQWATVLEEWQLAHHQAKGGIADIPPEKPTDLGPALDLTAKMSNLKGSQLVMEQESHCKEVRALLVRLGAKPTPGTGYLVRSS